MQAIILSAGRGKRLSKWITYPKCLIKLNSNQTLIERIIDLLNKEGISDIHLVLGYKSNLIKKKIKTKKDLFNRKIKFIKITDKKFLPTYLIDNEKKFKSLMI